MDKGRKKEQNINSTLHLFSKGKEVRINLTNGIPKAEFDSDTSSSDEDNKEFRRKKRHLIPATNPTPLEKFGQESNDTSKSSSTFLPTSSNNSPNKITETQLTLDAITFTPGNSKSSSRRRTKLRKRFRVIAENSTKINANTCKFCYFDCETKELRQIHEIESHTLLYAAFQKLSTGGSVDNQLFF